MPSSLSHAMIAVAAGSAVAPRSLFKPFLLVGAICAVLPDLDFVGRLYGGPADPRLLGGHRGFTHSLCAAALVGSIAAVATCASPQWRGYRVRFGLFIAFATAAHGALDALTTIGATTSPVQFFSPFSGRGYTSSWRPIKGPFSELFFCLIPLILVTRFIWYRRDIPWPRKAKETPVTLELAHHPDNSVDSMPGSPRGFNSHRFRWVLVHVGLLVACLLVLFAGWRTWNPSPFDDGPFAGVQHDVPTGAPSQDFPVWADHRLIVYPRAKGALAPVVVFKDSTGRVKWSIEARGDRDCQVNSLRFEAYSTVPWLWPRVVGIVDWTCGGREQTVWKLGRDGSLKEYWYSW